MLSGIYFRTKKKWCKKKMSEELYLTGPVIVNGIADSDGDTLTNVEIRTIFTKYTNHLSDIQHDSIDYEGVKVLANWISENDTNIAGKTVPAKSWLATLKVTDTETIKAIQDGELTCFSLGSVSSTAKTREGWFINKRISYHDLKSIEDVIPLRISIVDEGANGFPFEVTDYLTYINKRSDKMTEKENIEDAKFSIKEFLGLKKAFSDMSINKAEENEPAPVEPAPTEAEQTIDALFEKIDLLLNEVAEIKQALATDEIEKAEEDEEENEPAKEEDEEEIEKAEETEEEEKQKEEEEDEEKIEKEVEETHIEKSTVKPHDIPVTSEPKSNFFTRTNRDALGRKIKN